MTDEQERFEDHTRKINAAFAKALTSGRLSHDENADNYVGWLLRNIAISNGQHRLILPTINALKEMLK